MGITLSSRKSQGGGLSLLIDLGLVYFALPAFLALPVQQIIMNTSYLNAYLDMVGALTTTGLRVFEDARLPGFHFWRAFVAWCGGALIWIAAGHFCPEHWRVRGFCTNPPHTQARWIWVKHHANNAFALPSNERAVSRLSWSNPNPVHFAVHRANASGGCPDLCDVDHVHIRGFVPHTDGVGFMGEALVFVFLIFALSRLSFTTDHGRLNLGGLRQDVELRLASVLIIGVPLLLFLRHWAVALGIESDNELLSALRALWGALFTVASFLTTRVHQ